MKKILFSLIPLIGVFFIGNKNIPDKNPENDSLESKTEALEALAFMGQINAYPATDIIPGKYVTEYNYYKKRFAHAGIRGAEDTWNSIGPNNVGGRTVSIAIDPVDTNIIWMGSASGGLWKSETGGIGLGAWQYISTGFPVLGVAAIAINPLNTQEIYIGTGETYSYGTSTNGLVTRTERGSFGIGILKSADGGITWQKSLDWTYQENRGVWDIIFNPLDTNSIYAATTEGVYKTIDGGATWNISLDKKMVMDIEMNLNNPDIIFAGVGNLSSTGKGIYRSQDAGATWNLLSTGLPSFTNNGRITITAYRGNYNILMAVIGDDFSTVGIYETVNGGDSWALKSSDEIVSYQGWYAKGLLYNASDSTKILTGGVYLFNSTDGGDNFNLNPIFASTFDFGHPDIHNIIANPLDKNKVYIISDGGLTRSNDFGETFYNCNDGYVTTQFYIGSVSAQNPNIALGGLQDNNTVRYSGTNYWNYVIGGDGCFNAINQQNDFIQYGAYQYGNIYKSTDQGFSWEYIYTSEYADVAFVAPFVVSQANPDIIYFGDARLSKTTDAGTTWFTNDASDVDGNNPIISIAVSASNPDSVYFATAPLYNNASLFRSIDGDITHTNITGTLPDRYLRDIEINPKNSNEIYVCFSGFGTGHIYKSENAGDTWNDITGDLPDIPFHSIMVDPYNDSIIYAGSDFSVFISYNKGATWDGFNPGLPDAAMVFDLIVSKSDSTLMAFTHGNGVYKIPLQGKKQQVISSIPEQEILTATIYPSPTGGPLNFNVDARTNSDIGISIFDMAGKKVFAQSYAQIITGENNFNINISDLQAGNYIVSISQDEEKYVKKIIKI